MFAACVTGGKVNTRFHLQNLTACTESVKNGTFRRGNFRSTCHSRVPASIFAARSRPFNSELAISRLSNPNGVGHDQWTPWTRRPVPAGSTTFDTPNAQDRWSPERHSSIHGNNKQTARHTGNWSVSEKRSCKGANLSSTTQSSFDPDRNDRRVVRILIWRLKCEISYFDLLLLIELNRWTVRQ